MKISLSNFSIDLNEEKLFSVAESIHQFIFISRNHFSEIYYASPTYEKIFDADPESLKNEPKSWMNFIHPEDKERITKAIETNFGRKIYDLDFKIVRKDGIQRWILARFIEVERNRENKENYTIGIFEDVTERKKQQKLIDYLGHYDYLTGLPNRILFNKKLKQEIENIENENSKIAILVIDLDNFKDVNDSLGHQIGDELLQVISQDISFTLTKEKSLARLGGDEFILFYKNPKTKNEIIAFALEILNVFVNPFFIRVHELYTSASIGISIYPDDGNDITTLVKNAELAMYFSKSQGKNYFKFFEPNMSEAIQEKLLIELFLRTAIEKNELSLQYQPQINMEDNSLVGAEALLRWNNSQLGSVSPAKFIPIAEENGMIFPIGEWILTEVCAQIKKWQKLDFQAPRISVNISVKQLEQGNLFNFVKKLIQETEIQASNLELEITESIIMHKTNHNIEILDGLKSCGIQLSVDDFGTGYSSLKYLTRLPIHKLKIDQSFVREIGKDTNEETVIISIIALAKSLGFSVIAEGVETLEHKSFLLKHGCPIAQGYLFSKSLSPEVFFNTYNKLIID
ncbi:MAG: EAL domain-containing protein [Leptospiraceae bacterium]|nr:EAL domain-containing protein [Leptospiraceae bacterium]